MAADGAALIAQFFTALEQQRLDVCGRARARLRRLARGRPEYAPWCDYFAGILANERDHDWAAAERLFQRVAGSGCEVGLQLRALFALGRTYDYQGRWNEALATFEEHRALATRHAQPIEQAKAWKHMAITYQNGFARGAFGDGELRAAAACCEQALAVLAPVPPSEHIRWLVGSVWNTLGVVAMSSGDLERATNCYLRDLAICEELGEEYAHGAGVTHLNLGEVYQQRGSQFWPDARAAFDLALAALRAHGDRYLEIDTLANLAWLYQEMGDAAAALTYYHEAIAVVEALRRAAGGEAARAGFFATMIDIYANAVLLSQSLGRTADAFDLCERARARAFQDLLGARSPRLARGLGAPTLTLPEVQAALPAGAALVEYFTTGLVEARDHPAARPGQRWHRIPPPRVLIFAITPDAARLVESPLPLDVVRPQRLTSVVERYFLDPAPRRVLYDGLIAPVLDEVAGAARLYLAPHGPLNYVPFAALLAPDGTTLLREGGPQLVFGASATFLLSPRRPPATPAPRTALAVGYNGEPPQRLSFAEAEARGVARVTGGWSLTGPAPKKRALLADAGQYRVLHLSCHGTFDPDAPLESALHLAAGEDLTALEALNHMRLRADLVTLSACESGLSVVRRGEELVGLPRAFLYAGARAVIASLWRVDERSTRLLMERLYHELQGGAGPAEALQRAQLFLMRLTRGEERALLRRSIAADLLAGSPPPAGGRARPAQRRALADSFLKGQGADTPRPANEGADDAPVFAEPFYWAPFILIGAAD